MQSPSRWRRDFGSHQFSLGEGVFPFEPFPLDLPLLVLPAFCSFLSSAVDRGEVDEEGFGSLSNGLGPFPAGMGIRGIMIVLPLPHTFVAEIVPDIIPEQYCVEFRDLLSNSIRAPRHKKSCMNLCTFQNYAYNMKSMPWPIRYSVESLLANLR